MADIAAQAGVSKGAASFALNGRTGVSDRTRQRVLAIAEQLGWSANNAARALSADRSDAIGLVLARPPRLLSLEPFYMELVSGIETVLAAGSVALLLKMVPDPENGAEIATYRQWATARRVDGVIVTDLRAGDTRPAVLAEVGLPAVILGSTPSVRQAADFATVWTDDNALMLSALRYLTGLGHRRVARVSGPLYLAHCAARTAAFRRLADEFGLPEPTVMEADFSGEDGARLTRHLLLRAEPPTAIIYENDVMAVAAVGAAQALGLSVPRDVSILAGDDSALCGLTHPAVSAMRRDIPAMGQLVAQLLLESIDGAAPARSLTAQAELVPRGSTGPAKVT